MTYLKRTKRPNQAGFGAAIAAVALIILFAIGYFFPSFYPTVFFPVTSVFWKADSSAGGWLSTMGQLVGSKYSLIKQNEALQAEVAARDHDMLILGALQNENETLKNDFNRTGKGTYVLGNVMARPPVSPYDTLVLDIGTDDGIKVGDKVYAEGDQLVGNISDVFAGESKANLYSTPGQITSILVGTSTIAAQATGNGGGNFTFKLPATVPLVVGATITLPGIHSNIFGIVSQINVDSSASVQTVHFRSPVNIDQLSYVEVAK